MSGLDLWRSQAMRLASVTISREVAPAVVEEMMALGCVHFIDACSDTSYFDRIFTGGITQLNATESKLDYLREQFLALGISLPEQENAVDVIPQGNMDVELGSMIKTIKTLSDEYQQHVSDLASNILYSQVLDVVRRTSSTAASQQNKLLRDIISDNTHLVSSQDEEAHETDADATLYFMACTISDTATPMLQRLIMRATLSNCMFELVGKISAEDSRALMEDESLKLDGNSAAARKRVKGNKKKKKETAAAKDQQEYDILFIYTPGPHLQSKVSSIVTSLSGTVHIAQGVRGTSTDNISQLENDTLNVQKSIEDHRTLLKLSRQRIEAILHQTGAKLEAYYKYVQKDKMILSTLNKLRPSAPDQKLLTGLVWIPEKMYQDAVQVIETCNDRYKGMIPSVIRDLNALDKRRKNGTSVLINLDGLPAETIDALHHAPHQHLRQPPTYFKVGKFTQVFQNIIESYGIPSYKEINPAFFYLYQFPFTFAVMYGDIGHGIILTLVSAIMVACERKLAKVKNDMVGLIFAGRYIILLMSIFSIFTGLMYNDTFALAFDMFHSKYTFSRSPANKNLYLATYDTAKYTSPVYAFGMDPAWRWSDNTMVFINSYKMKMAVVIGILQMIFGIVMKLLNIIYFKNMVDLFTCWIPEFLFMTCFFGYMVFCIIYKWLCEWPPGSNPPALTSLLIQMFLSPGKISPESVLFNDVKLQERVQLALFFICIGSVLWLAVTKPVYEIVHLKKAAKKGLPHKPPLFTGAAIANREGSAPPENSNSELGDEGISAGAGASVSVTKEKGAAKAKKEAKKGPDHGDDDDEESHGVGDIVVHQVIHTIEYVLGAISHTASYLRLWALSLAHAQLSEVFYEQLFTLSYGLMEEMSNKWVKGAIRGVSFFITYSAWFGVTIGVIVLMEALSAFLHGLRLAWIEFNSKFYQAEGYQFEPLAPEEYTLCLEKQDE